MATPVTAPLCVNWVKRKLWRFRTALRESLVRNANPAARTAKAITTEMATHRRAGDETGLGTGGVTSCRLACGSVSAAEAPAPARRLADVLLETSGCRCSARTGVTGKMNR